MFCLGEFVWVVTHSGLFNPLHSADEACLALDELVASPSLTVLCPGRGFPALLTEAVREANAIGNLVFDARNAAPFREHGVVRQMTEGRDFDRFAGLDTWRLEYRSRP